MKDYMLDDRKESNANGQRDKELWFSGTGRKGSGMDS